MTEPLAMPPNYNPKTHLLYNETENGLFHESRRGAWWARQLVANGTPQDLELAEKVLDVVLGCQERHEGDAHYGNFTWMIEDSVVEDLNAVEFNLEHLIPMMIEHSRRLSPAMQQRVLDAIRLGLAEIGRLDVLLAYSNITMLDILNTCLGGELLGEKGIARRGYNKLKAWMAFTDSNGTLFEYNSPTYAAVSVRALNELAGHVRDKNTRLRARTMAARIGLSVALHIHSGTGRWAGPHSRAYQPSVVADTPPEAILVAQWIKDEALPLWVGDAFTLRAEPFEVTETASRQRQMALTTYQSPPFALGVSSKEYSGQSDVMMLHYNRPGAERPGIMYTRYLTNDKWLGDFYHATDRTKSRNLIEEGLFYGVQNGPRAIGLYTLGQIQTITSAKACFIFTEIRLVDEIWIGDRRVEALPAEVAPGEVVVITSGEAMVAFMPLARTDMGRGAPVRLVDMKGDLVFEIYNYLGAPKGFWEMRWPGYFFRGKPQCGVYLEVAERSAHRNGAEFAHVVQSGKLVDTTETPFTSDGARERLWTVEYSRDGKAVGIQVDLMGWALKRRWTEEGERGWPPLAAPFAHQSSSGLVSTAGATLTCGKEPAWLYANPRSNLFVAGYHGKRSAPLTLRVPGGRVEIAAMGTGTVMWDNGKVTVDAIGVQGPPAITYD
jgi:hypothetical protein